MMHITFAALISLSSHSRLSEKNRHTYVHILRLKYDLGKVNFHGANCVKCGEYRVSKCRCCCLEHEELF